jgi:hypothetical protein
VLFPPYGLYKVCAKAEEVVDSLHKPLFYFPDHDPQNERPDEDSRRED